MYLLFHPFIMHLVQYMKNKKIYFDNKFCYFYSNTLIIVLPNIFFKYQFSCISLLSWSTKVDFYQSEFLISKWIGRIIAHGFTYLQINDFHEIQKKILQRILMKPQYTVKQYKRKSDPPSGDVSPDVWCILNFYVSKRKLKTVIIITIH